MIAKQSIRLVTRQSKLALWQANFVKYCLENLHHHVVVEIHPINTRGDQVLDTPLFTIGGKGLFTHELEAQLLSGQVDLAVHSMKDLPAALPQGLEITTILQRADARDAFVSYTYPDLNSLPLKARVGTSSLRRQSQLLALRPDLQCVFLRGNVDTRLQKLASGEFDAIILAVAGLERLGRIADIKQYLSYEEMLPAAGQGALGIECRDDNQEIKHLLAPLNHPLTHYCVSAERALVSALGGGCTAPIASYAEIQNGTISLKGLVGRVDGQALLRAEGRGALHDTDAAVLGSHVAEQLKQQGAQTILEQL